MSQPKLLDTPLYALLHKDDDSRLQPGTPQDATIDMRGGDFRGLDLRDLDATGVDFTDAYAAPPTCAAWTCATARGGRQPGPCTDLRHLLPA